MGLLTSCNANSSNAKQPRAGAVGPDVQPCRIAQNHRIGCWPRLHPRRPPQGCHRIDVVKQAHAYSHYALVGRAGELIHYDSHKCQTEISPGLFGDG